VKLAPAVTARLGSLIRLLGSDRRRVDGALARHAESQASRLAHIDPKTIAERRPMSFDTNLLGLKVVLDRNIDRAEGCCNNHAIITPGKGPHRYALRCAKCGRHRGWISHKSASFFERLVGIYGEPKKPLVVRGGHG
jgi:hypothetical protein